MRADRNTDNADDQQVQQALRDHAHDAQHDRRYHQQQEKGDHPSSVSSGCSAAG
jgi:hypothetical protein